MQAWGMIILLVSTTAAILWSLWSRRLTWNYKWERGTTITLVPMALGAILTSPLTGAYLAPVMHWLSGVWNLEDVIGDVLLLFAACGICHMVVGRTIKDPNVVLSIYVYFPAAFSISAILTAFILGGGEESIDKLEKFPINGWIQTYWILVCGSIAWLLGYALWVLLILSRDRRHRTIANLYMAACASGVAACVTAIIDVLIQHTITPNGMMVSSFAFLWLAGFAIAAGYSWRRKMRPYRRLMWGLTHKGRRPPPKNIPNRLFDGPKSPR